MQPVKKFFSGVMGKFYPCPANLDDLKPIIQGRYSSKYNHCDEVWNGIYLGDAKGAKDLVLLEKLKVSHIINCAFGAGSFLFVDTDEKFYQERNYKCTFKGVSAMDVLGFDISIYFKDVANFIEAALKNDGKIYIHCYQGVSRSATLVIAYLMIKQKMTAVEAVKWVRGSREIYPNEGFLEQLCELDAKLKNSPSASHTANN